MTDKVDFNKSFYDKQWARSWKSRFMYDPISKLNVARYVLRNIGFQDTGKNILDIGFGFGIILFSFDRSNRIHGIELSESAVEFARRTSRKRGFQNSDFTCYQGSGQLPVADGAYDLVLCSHVLEHVPDDAFLLKEIRRVVHPSGLVFLNVPINEQHFDDPRHMRKYTEESIVKLVQEQGFRVLSTFPTDRTWNVFGWFFEKGYHKRIPILGFIISSILNMFFSSIPFRLQLKIENSMLRSLLPRQFALCAVPVSKNSGKEHAVTSFPKQS